MVSPPPGPAPAAGKSHAKAATARPGALHGQRVRLFDFFAAANLAVLGVFTVLVSWPRFVAFRTRACAEEFLAYLGLTLMLLAAAWQRLRRTPPHPVVLMLFQVAIVLAVSGAGLPYQGQRLYEAVLWGVTFDKLVHFVWALAGGLFVAAVLRQHAVVPTWLEKAVVVLATMGLGAAWELVEYGVATRVAYAGVGLYDNNMQDFLANTCGALASLVAPRRWTHLARPEGEGEGDK